MRDKWFDTLMERTVLPSFSSLGPRIRRRAFDWKPLDDFDLAGRTVVLTGGTSGIGERAAMLYARLGATLVLVARDADKVRRTADAIASAVPEAPPVDHVIADLGALDEVRAAAAELTSRHPRIDVLSHNAGALFDERRRAADGTDLAVQLMVVSPFLLTASLLDSLRAAGTVEGRAPARVLTMSSGGMYTEPLRVDGLEMPDDAYRGAKQYARAKRAQVTLDELWSERVDAREIVFHALHPGWVDTPGINDALPGFSRVLGPLGLLRDATEGADTLVWLSVADEPTTSSGDFWLDRRRRSTHLLGSTRERETAERRERLWRWCARHAGIDPVVTT